MEPFDSPVLKLLIQLGGHQAVANAIGGVVTRQHVSYWVNNDLILPEHWRKVCELLAIDYEVLVCHAEERARRLKAGGAYKRIGAKDGRARAVKGGVR